MLAINVSRLGESHDFGHGTEAIGLLVFCNLTN